MDNMIDFDAPLFAVSSASDHGRTYVYDFRSIGTFRDAMEVRQWVKNNYEYADNFHWLPIADRGSFDVDLYHSKFRVHACCGAGNAAFTLYDGSIIVCAWNYGH